MSRLKSLLQTGLESLRSGRLIDARAAFAAVLDASPYHPDAHYFLAHTAFLAGQLHEAERYIGLALLYDPKRADFHVLFGNVLQRQGQLERAEGHYRSAVRIDAGYAEAYLNLGNVLGEQGRADEALAAYAAALALKPDLLVALLNRAALLKRSGNVTEARREYEEMERRFPASAEVLYARARFEHETGERAEARRRYERLLAVFPAHAHGLNGFGALLLAQSEEEAALAHFERCLAEQPAHHAALANAAGILRRRGNLERAAALLRRLLKIEPENAEIRLQLGQVLAGAARYGEALQELLRLRKERPDWTAVHLAIASAYYQVGRFENALAAATRARELEPAGFQARLYHGLLRGECDDPQAALDELESLLAEAPADPQLLNAIGVQLCALNRHEEGIAHFRQVLERNPRDATAHNNLSSALLAVGDFANGWRHQRMRADVREQPHWPGGLECPLWSGEPLGGKSLYVWSEQGLGDQVMFASMFPDLLAAGAACTFQVDPRLERLFARSFPAARVLGKRPGTPADAPTPDYQVPMSGLGEFLRSARERFPQHAGYLAADTTRRLHWRTRLTALGPGLRVGISWRGGTERTGRRQRSIALQEWRALLERPDVRYVSLQYGDCRQEIDALRAAGTPIAHWQEAIDDLDECAALLCELDLVISVPTTVIHLAGALARPVWVLVPARPGWRYLLQGERLPWYPSARLWREAEATGWRPVLERVANAISLFRP